MTPVVRRPRGDAGFTAVEAAIVLPFILLSVWAVMQGAIYYVAIATASSAAQNGADVARLQGNTVSDGARSADQFAVHQGDGWLTGITVSTSTRQPTFVTVVVTGHPFAIIPGFGHFTIRRSATAPVERFTTATGPPP